MAEEYHIKFVYEGTVPHLVGSEWDYTGTDHLDREMVEVKSHHPGVEVTMEAPIGHFKVISAFGKPVGEWVEWDGTGVNPLDEIPETIDAEYQWQGGGTDNFDVAESYFFNITPEGPNVARFRVLGVKSQYKKGVE